MFFKDDNIVRWITQFDIIFLTETHFTKGQTFDLSNYKSYHNPISTVNDRKARWGISCFISNKTMQYVLNVDRTFDNHILVTLKEGHRIFGSYIPPSDSIYYKDEYFYAVPTFLSPIDNDRVFIGGGDMNSRVGERVQLPKEVNGVYRANPDTFTNSHGKILKNICKNSNCVLLNNLEYNAKRFDGDFTFERAGNKSQNDFCITNVTGLRYVEMFTIHNLAFNFSDHKPISATCKIPILTGANPSSVAKDLLSNACDKSMKRQKKIDSACMDWKAYETLASLKLRSIANELCTVEYSEELFEKAVNDMDNTLYKSALFCQGRLNNIHEPVETFSDEIRTADDVQKDITKKEHERWNEIMNSSDPKSLWKEIAWKETTQDIHTSTPSAEEFGEFFLSKATIKGEKPFVLDPLEEGRNCPELDEPISVGEVYAAEKRLKEGKSTADGWTTGMLKSVSALLYPLLVMIFNMILQFRHYPEKWRNTVVNTLFKNKGVTWLPKYFRPISLVQLLAKMFDFILLDRFRKWFQPHDCQSAYQCGKCCAGHIFLLRALICYCMSTNSKLFIICIDFEGAFDKVSRHRLFRKLHLFGCGTVFLSCLMAIYAVTPCTIFQGVGSYTYL